ncbi:hypothetical protein M440DRAFT_1465344 [Trichoderma longibrachiatum ATCC 18648]|uniref:Uncharacterized protein n=1 Tax=Trichoderma longibrachiatum ATCC 18648 TaxID=983965 RepID=A0A2T4BTV3_TRILO|nr:hypothetical protein M440DRAFT_1465344 [Trichoderma longibrachiatum ATCC 18648]
MDMLQQPTKRATMPQRARYRPLPPPPPLPRASIRKSRLFIVESSPSPSPKRKRRPNEPQPRPLKRRQLHGHHPLRDAPPHDVLSVRASSVLQGALEDSLLHHRMAKPVAAWSEDDLYTWYGQYLEESDSRPRDPRTWREWRDDRRLDDEDKMLQKQLERWCVKCPLCLLHRDTRCNGHDLSECSRPERKLACLIERRLGGTLANIQLTGLRGYGEEWRQEKQGACQSYKWVVLRAVSAMLSFALPSGATLLQQAEAWRKDSRTHFNRELDLGGWLLSPMRWGSRQVVIMLRVFHQLDMAVEEAWVLKAVERRQVELNALGLQQWKDREAMASHDVVTADVKPTKLDIKVLNSMRGAARYHEEQRKHRLSCGRPDAYWREVRDRIREWGQGGIRCQLCRANRWSEQCYRHSASACSAWKESESYRMLVDKLSGLEGMGRGDGAGDGTCQRCMFPVQVCQLAAPEPSSIDSTADEWGACRGTEVMKQTVAALLMREGGALGTQVINQEMAE